MKPVYEDSDLLEEPLVKWLKTFKYEFKGAEFKNLSQLIGSDFLDNVMYLIRFSQKPQSADSDVKLPTTIADRLHQLRGVLQQILEFYKSNLKQVVMLPAPNLVTISEALKFEDCENEMKLLLLLILGCAAQCALKDKFISRISELLDVEDQEYIEKYFGQLANNSMTADHTSLDLDENMLQMHHHVTQLTYERRIYFEKYYDCFEKHSCDSLEDNNGVLNPVPIFIQPIVPVNHGGQWELATPRKRFRGAADRNEEDVLVVRYRPTLKKDDKPLQSSAPILTPENAEKLKIADEKIKENQELEKELIKLKQKLNDLEVNKKKADDKIKENQELEKELIKMKQKLNDLEGNKKKADDKIIENEELEKDLIKMKQQLKELDFNKKKLNDLNVENSQLVADKQKLRDQLQISRRKEEDVIERLVDCQMKLDDTIAEREMDRQKISELMKSNRGNKSQDEESDNDQLDPKNGKNKRIQELEKEIESLRTRLMESQKQDNQKDEKWKMLDLQKEKVDARRQLNDALESNEDLKRKLDKCENQLKNMQNELIEAQDIANITRAANDDQVSQFEDRIKDLSNQVMLLRKKGGKLSGDQFKDLENEERDVMYETVQELTNEVTKLKAHNKILRQTCDKLKQDVDKVILIEGENERLSDEKRKLQQAMASTELNSEQIDELRKQNLQLAIENKKLRRMIDTLRFTLMQVDPYNKHKYTYITSI